MSAGSIHPDVVSATSTSGLPISIGRSPSTATGSGSRSSATDGRWDRTPRSWPPGTTTTTWAQRIRERRRRAASHRPHRPLPRGFVYPDGHELARAVNLLRDHGYPIDHATDHGATVSVYLSDPDGNGIELYFDRPRERWFAPDGTPLLEATRIELSELTRMFG